MKALLLALFALTAPLASHAGTAYMCGTTDGAQKFIFKHANLNYVKAYTLSQCQANSAQPERCFEAYCQAYDTGAPAPRVAPQVARRRAPVRKPVARRPAPRRRAPQDDCDAECGAVRAVHSAQEQIRKDELDRLLRDYRDGKLHR